jgi:hypothetical protein
MEHPGTVKVHARFVVLIAVIMKITIWDVMLCGLVGIYQHFRVTYTSSSGEKN